MVFYVVACHGLLRNGSLFECVCACLCLMWMCLCVCVESLQRPEVSCQVRVVRFYVSLISSASTSSSSSSLPHGVIMSEKLSERMSEEMATATICAQLRSAVASVSCRTSTAILLGRVFPARPRTRHPPVFLHGLKSKGRLARSNARRTVRR